MSTSAGVGMASFPQNDARPATNQLAATGRQQDSRYRVMQFRDGQQSAGGRRAGASQKAAKLSASARAPSLASSGAREHQGAQSTLNLSPPRAVGAPRDPNGIKPSSIIGAHHKALRDGVADVEAAPVAVHTFHQQPEGRLAPAQHRLAAVGHVQVRQLRHAPLQQRTPQNASSGPHGHRGRAAAAADGAKIRTRPLGCPCHVTPRIRLGCYPLNDIPRGLLAPPPGRQGVAPRP